MHPSDERENPHSLRLKGFDQISEKKKMKKKSHSIRISLFSYPIQTYPLNSFFFFKKFPWHQDIAWPVPPMHNCTQTVVLISAILQFYVPHQPTILLVVVNSTRWIFYIMLSGRSDADTDYLKILLLSASAVQKQYSEDICIWKNRLTDWLLCCLSGIYINHEITHENLSFFFMY